MRKGIWLVGIAIMVGLVSSEAFARLILGLGTPPLSIEDPTIEYMFKPSQDVWRFGNHQIFNEYGMRSEPLTSEKAEDEFRILAIGDSVLNGGSLTHHDDLATSVLSRDHVRVLNASAGSWGPPNMQAYINKFGLFEADLLVVVLSSHDAGDVPTFAPLNPDTHPRHRPFLALTEGITRYLPRYFPSFNETASSGTFDESGEIKQQALDAVTALANAPIPTCFVLHPNRDELENKEWNAGYAAIMDAANGAKIVSGMRFMKSSTDYRDNIHLSSEGQDVLAQAISACR